ncbi:hypothetical protein SAMN05421858_5042 [Haladaptatus litoreus]|uniref:Uncharacterized protein n=1 Tax=Haladaptatus litoreus TaxID=553468 RepID=A0A1N7FFL0_9EURY|nr:hypothetical protein SAMN05421858_5042 [Haladaptatus litoreus]
MGPHHDEIDFILDSICEDLRTGIAPSDLSNGIETSVKDLFLNGFRCGLTIFLECFSNTITFFIRYRQIGSFIDYIQCMNSRITLFCELESLIND